MSTHLYALVQATDLRAMEASFRSSLFESLRGETSAQFGKAAVIAANDDEFFQAIIDSLIVLLNASTGDDSQYRFKGVFTKLSGTLQDQLTIKLGAKANITLADIDGWKQAMSKKAEEAFIQTRDRYVPAVDSPGSNLLGRTKILYDFVRGDLGVMLHWGDPEKDKTEIGTEIAKIFRSFEDGSIAPVLLQVIRHDS
jgi:phenylalanine ammonia-lyase